MKVIINGMTVEGTASEIRELGILNIGKSAKLRGTLTCRGRKANPESKNSKIKEKLGLNWNTPMSTIMKDDILKSKYYKLIAAEYSKSVSSAANRGRPKDPTSRSAKAMKLIGMPDGTTYTNLQKGSKEQKNFWRAIEYLRGKVHTLNLIG